MRHIAYLILVLSILLFGPPVFANYMKGVHAYLSGDYEAAQKVWKPLADQGDAASQYHLALSYAKGYGAEGVRQSAARLRDRL